MCLIAAIMVGVAGNQLYLDKIKFHELMLSDGIVFLLFFAIFMYYIYNEAASGAAHQHAAGAGSSGSSEETGNKRRFHRRSLLFTSCLVWPVSCSGASLSLMVPPALPRTLVFLSG